MSDEACILVDWGTSNLRLWSVNKQGEILQEYLSDKGMSKLSPDDFAPTLEALLSDMQVQESTAVLMCGMVGAASGWQEAPYLDAPTKLNGLASATIQLDQKHRDIRIIPGIAQKDTDAADVMRGEETLLLGLGKTDGQILLPGTHSKWVQMKAGRLTHFHTVMTGEIFALLKDQSILRHTLSSDDWAEDIFLKAVTEGFEAPERTISRIFSLRAGPLLFGKDLYHAGISRLSGWLIGAEIATHFIKDPSPLILLSNGNLGRNYAAALTNLNIHFTSCDATRAAQLGLLACARAIWPSLFE